MSVVLGEDESLRDSSLLDNMPSIITAAHELKSPLALIRQLALTLQQSNIDLTDRNRILQQINLTSDKALRLTSDLTKSFRLDDGMFKLEPINPYQICEDIVKELEPLYRAYGRRLLLLNRKSPLLLVANRDLLRRIITNFSDNALYYTDSSLPIEIKVSLNGKMVRLGVRDYGPSAPINMKVMKSSDRYANIIENINSRPQSSGLGLYIVRQFADTMNGRVGITRHSNGTTFYVELHASHQLSLL